MCLANDGKYLQPWRLLRNKDQGEVETLLKRLAGPSDQSAVMEKLKQFIWQGFQDHDCAGSSRVSSSEKSELNGNHIHLF